MLTFFCEIYSATKSSLSMKAKTILPKLGACMLNAGGAVAPIADAAGAGAIASGVVGWLGKLGLHERTHVGLNFLDIGKRELDRDVTFVFGMEFEGFVSAREYVTGKHCR